ncbi:MAG: MmgE/PrpD family protein [Rhodobacteraceae bacterium]|jgi:2-methylcitrate dehydratase PrpD|nr:MmgE/PrpD family protein [Hellea sp.]MBT4777743.1 MmgE/PrpD family protein [Paracoccaceae bacterium]
MTNRNDALSNFSVNMQFEDLHQDVVERAKLIIIDCVGAILGGVAEKDAIALINLRSQKIPGADYVKIIGTEQWAEKSQAALLYGTAGTVLEMDEGHQFAKGHPGIHVLPAILSMVQSNWLGRKVSGQEFLTAFIVGYDIAARIGAGSKLKHSMHPHGTWGVIGASVAIGKLLGLNITQTKELLNISSSLTTATSRKTMLEGGTVRNIYAGLSNQMAFLAIDLISANFTGENDGIQSVFGSIISDELNDEVILDHLGQNFEVMRNYFKLHACCRFNHATLDALCTLMERHPELHDTDNIESIDVESYNLAAELNDPAPKNMLAAKFSIPFAVATTLINKTSKVESFSGTALSDSDVLKVAKKVHITENHLMTASLPDFRPAKVSITLKIGKVLSHEVATNKGDWRSPYSPDELKEKFFSLAVRSLDREQTVCLYNNLTYLEKYDDIKTIFDIKHN